MSIEIMRAAVAEYDEMRRLHHKERERACLLNRILTQVLLSNDEIIKVDINLSDAAIAETRDLEFGNGRITLRGSKHSIDPSAFLTGD